MGDMQALFDRERMEELISTEHTQIDIEGAAKKLRKLKQYMGPVTVIWSDYILEAAKELPLSLRKRLVFYMERDIRRAVKKDKGDIIYGVIAAFFAEVTPEPEMFRDDAIDFVRRAGYDPVAFKNALVRLRNVSQKILASVAAVAKKFDPELYELLLQLPKGFSRTVYFERFGARSVKFVKQNLAKALKQYEEFKNHFKGGNRYDGEA
jgi:hypothetical protein